MANVDTEAATAALARERARLVYQLIELGADEDGDLRSDHDFGDGGFADAGAATAERTEVLGVVDSLKAQIDDIDAASQRIASGNYGTCAGCGSDIPAVRLEARPMSILCVDCKNRHG